MSACCCRESKSHRNLSVSVPHFDERTERERSVPIVSANLLGFDLERIQRILLSKRLSRIVRLRGARSTAKAGDAHSRNAPVW